jgi:glycosyltransferase involved in cell wall biosynthesis
MAPNPLVSIILLSYNQGEYVMHALNSVLQQTYPNLELLVVDNGSTDGSQDRLRTHEPHSKVRLFLYPRHERVSVRLNQALDQIRGDFVGFLYSDDYYLPTKLERQVAAFTELPDDYGVVYSPHERRNVMTGQSWVANSVGCSGWVFPDLMSHPERGEVDMNSPLTRRDCFARHRFHADISMETESIFLRIALTHRFHFLPYPMAILRDHASNSGKAIKSNFETSLECVHRLRGNPNLPAHYRSLVDRYEGWLLRQYGWQAVRLDADARWARGCFKRAAAVRRRELLHIKTLVGFALTFVPAHVLRVVNSIGHIVRPSPSYRACLTDYQGPQNTGTAPPVD